MWLEERGWTRNVLDEEIIGDIEVIDPNTGKPISVYEALDIHLNGRIFINLIDKTV